MTNSSASESQNKLYENFNYDNILIRSVIAGLLDLLNNKVDYSQFWDDNIEERVVVPWMYNMGTSDERFVQDNYTFFGQNCFGGNKITGTFNSIPRGYIQYDGSNIESSSICNRFVQGTYLRNVGGKLTTYTSFLYSIPLTVNFSCTVECDNMITALKIEQALRETFYKNKTFFVLFRGMKINCTAGFPEQISNDIIKTTEYSFDNVEKRPKLTFSLSVETYQPVFDRTTEIEASKAIKYIGGDIFVKSNDTSTKIIKFDEMTNKIFPSGVPVYFGWTYNSGNSEMLNISLKYIESDGTEHIISNSLENQMFYVWDIPEKFGSFKQPSIILDSSYDDRIIEMPVIKIIPEKGTKLLKEDSFICTKRGYIIPNEEIEQVPITIEYKYGNKIDTISDKYALNLNNGKVDKEHPVSLLVESPDKYKGKVEYKEISLKIEYTNDSKVFDKIDNVLIL